MWVYHVPPTVVQRFRELGATRYSITILKDRYHDYSDRERCREWSDIVYFWTADNREIGYCTSPNPDNPQFFPADKPRVWGREFLESQRFNKLWS